jgi:hypothetical protein
MPQPARKRPGSPIGKTGPRKTNPKYKRRRGEPWTPQEVRELKSLAKQNAPTGIEPRASATAGRHSQQGAARRHLPTARPNAL